jgi:hypothetical protein
MTLHHFLRPGATHNFKTTHWLVSLLSQKFQWYYIVGDRELGSEGGIVSSGMNFMKNDLLIQVKGVDTDTDKNIVT